MEKNDFTKIVQKILQEILVEDPNYFLPKQFHVLTWKSKKIEGALITKINGQRYLGLVKKDRTGQEYWSYKLLREESSSSVSSAETKPEQPSLESSQVQKFKEKYGTVNEPKPTGQ